MTYASLSPSLAEPLPEADVAIIVVGETPYAEGIGDRKGSELVLTEEQRELIRSYSDAAETRGAGGRTSSDVHTASASRSSYNFV